MHSVDSDVDVVDVNAEDELNDIINQPLLHCV